MGQLGALLISNHARDRFVDRVSVIMNPVRTLQNMWECGKEASDVDIMTFGAARRDGCTYRIAHLQGYGSFLLVVRGHTLVTVIPPYYNFGQ